MLRTVFWSKRDKVTEERRRIHNKELYDLHTTKYYSSDQIKFGRACHMYGDRRGAYRVLVGRLDEKGPLGRPRCRWDGDDKTDFQEVGLFWLRLGTGGGSL
jgi:hypothetical protein